MEHLHSIIAARQAPGGPPPFPDPALLPHDTLRPNIITAACLCYAIAIVFVGARVYTKQFMTRTYGWDDTLLIISLVIAGVETAGQIHGAVLGVGSHVWDVPPENQTKMMIAGYYSTIAYLFTTVFCKVSVLITYRTIFAKASPINRWANHIVMGLVALQTVWVFACFLTWCVPLEAYWNPMITDKWCWPQEIWTFNNSTHAITDFFIFCLPLPMLRQLHVPRRQRIFLFAIFSIGFFVCFISIIRLVVLTRILGDPTLMMDASYNTTPISYWNVIEINLGIVVACLMTLRPLAARFAPKIFATTFSRTGGASGPSKPRSGFTGEFKGSKGVSSNNSSRGGELTNFDNDEWLEAQSHNGAELAIMYSKSTLNTPMSAASESKTELNRLPQHHG